MRFYLGESVQIGVGKEATRNTKVAPFDWIATTASPDIQESLEKVTLNTSVGKRSATRGERIIRRMYNGTISSYMSVRALPLYLLSLMGTLTTTGTTAYTHAATIDAGEIISPTLSFALAREDFTGKDYSYTGGVVSSLVLGAPLDNIPTMEASIMARTEVEEGTKLTPAYTETGNVPFSQDKVEIKIAANEAGLASATAKEVNSATVTLSNGATGRPTLSEKNYKEILAGLMSGSASIEVDSNNDDYKALFTDNTTQAVSIKWIDMETPEISSGNRYTVEVIFPTAILTNRTENRSMGDVTTETLEITAHQMGSTDIFKVNVINNVATY